MKIKEASKLKKGDLVIVSSSRTKIYQGLIFEIESVEPKTDMWSYRVTLKQPGFNGEFRLRDYDTRLLQRYES